MLLSPIVGEPVRLSYHFKGQYMLLSSLVLLSRFHY